MGSEDHNNGKFGHTDKTLFIFDSDNNEELDFQEFKRRYECKIGAPAKYCVPNFAKDSLVVTLDKEGLRPRYQSTNFERICLQIWDDLGNKDILKGIGAGNQRDAGLFIKIIEDEFEDEEINSIRIKAEISDECKINSIEFSSEAPEMKYVGSVETIDITKNLTKSLDVNKNIIVEGVAGSGKSHMLQGLRSSGAYGENGNRIDVVVFHPSTSYEEFVSGVRPNFTKQEGEGDFVTYEGVFVQMCNRAAQDPENRYLLFIDEINRANTSRVFGDLMLVLEKTKRQSFEGLSTEGRDGALFEASVEKMRGEYVRLQTPIIKNSKEYNKLVVPSNLHVLGTMNTTDRSVGTIDLALRRRFHWITQEPYTAEELKEAMGDEYPGAVASWYEKANGILLTKVGPDARLGHAYFFGKDGDEEAIAEALITQLLEIIFTFNIKDNVLQEIGVPPIPQYAGKKLGYRGEGLGRRPSIDNSQSSATPQAEESALENSGDDSVSENQ